VSETPGETPGEAPGGAQALAERVVAGMLAEDAFSRWLGIEVLEIAPHHSVARMTVRPEMCNGSGICHGGATFALADSAFAFACNTRGTVSVALDVSVSYPNAAHAGDVLTAVAEPETDPRRVGFWRVTVTDAAGAPVALFRGTAYDTRRPHAALAAAAPAAAPASLSDDPR
jgi:acyl-CoA thioesterase